MYLALFGPLNLLHRSFLRNHITLDLVVDLIVIFVQELKAMCFTDLLVDLTSTCHVFLILPISLTVKAPIKPALGVRKDGMMDPFNVTQSAEVIRDDRKIETSTGSKRVLVDLDHTGTTEKGKRMGMPKSGVSRKQVIIRHPSIVSLQLPILKAQSQDLKEVCYRHLLDR